VADDRIRLCPDGAAILLCADNSRIMLCEQEVECEGIPDWLSAWPASVSVSVSGSGMCPEAVCTSSLDGTYECTLESCFDLAGGGLPVRGKTWTLDAPGGEPPWIIAVVSIGEWYDGPNVGHGFAYASVFGYPDDDCGEFQQLDFVRLVCDALGDLEDIAGDPGTEVCDGDNFVQVVGGQATITV
jgi:hypothetical protein